MELYFSNANRWMICGASVERSNRQTAFDPSTAAEGVAAHAVAEAVLFGDAADAGEFEGETARNGVEITAEMIAAVDDYVSIVGNFVTDAYEHGVEATAGYNGARGRVDMFARLQRLLVVGEFKYGYRRVSPVDNWQLILAALSQYKSEKRVTMFIFSPRANPSEPYQTHSIGYEEMMAYARRVHSRITELEFGERTAVAGSHCARCPHAYNCGALGQWIEDRMDTTDLAELYKLQRLIKTRVTAVEADIEARILSGEFIPGWCIEQRRGHRQFKVDVATLEVTTGQPAVKVVPLSPNEMQQRGVPRKTIDSLTHRPFSGHKLKPWSADSAAKLFGSDTL